MHKSKSFAQWALTIGLAAQILYPAATILYNCYLRMSGDVYTKTVRVYTRDLYRGNIVSFRWIESPKIRDASGNLVEDKELIRKIEKIDRYVCDDTYPPTPPANGNGMKGRYRSETIEAEAVICTGFFGSIVKELLVEGKSASEIVSKDNESGRRFDRLATIVPDAAFLYEAYTGDNLFCNRLCREIARVEFDAVLLPIGSETAYFLVNRPNGGSLGSEIRTGTEVENFCREIGSSVLRHGDSNHEILSVFPLVLEPEHPGRLSPEEWLKRYVEMAFSLYYKYRPYWGAQPCAFYGDYPLPPEMVLRILKEGCREDTERRGEVLWFYPVEQGKKTPEELDPKSVILVRTDDSGEAASQSSPDEKSNQSFRESVLRPYIPFSLPAPKADFPKKLSEEIDRFSIESKESKECWWSVRQERCQEMLEQMASALLASDPALANPEKRQLYRTCIQNLSDRKTGEFFRASPNYEAYRKFVRWAGETYGETVPFGDFPVDIENPPVPPVNSRELEKDEFATLLKQVRDALF
ncbi:MAG: hypothetical protein ACI4QT_01280 [Kiritimatiellia bacterium]